MLGVKQRHQWLVICFHNEDPAEDTVLELLTNPRAKASFSILVYRFSASDIEREAYATGLQFSPLSTTPSRN